MFARMLIAGLALLAIAALAGCGESAQEKSTKVRHTQELLAQRKHRQALAQATREYQACESRVGPFIKSLNALKGHQEIGLTESDYTSRLGDTQAILKELPKISETSLRCGEAMLPALKANLDEVKAAEYWSNCVETLACDEATKKRTIQADWSKADLDLEQAETKITAIKTPPEVP